VPQPRDRLRLEPEAGPLGRADHDRALSERRVNAVRDHLLHQGVSRGLLTTSFTGKDLSVSNSDEDEGDRAVLVVVEGIRSSFPRFDRANPGGKNDGFERRRPFGGGLRPVNTLGVAGGQADPILARLSDSQIMPLGEDGKVRAENAVGLFAVSGDPDVAFVVNPTEPAIRHVFIDKNPQTIRIHGVRADDAFIFLNISGPSRPDERITSGLAVLEATVLPPVTVKVMFHFVTGPSGVATGRQDGFAKEIIEDLNQIYTPQTNITFKPFGAGFTRHSIAGLTAGGVKVQNQGESPDFKTVVDARDKGADLNVFFVGKVINVDGPALDGSSTLPPDDGRDIRVSIIADASNSPDPVEELVAHEIAHTLGERHDKSENRKPEEQTIMAQPRPTTRIPRAMAKRMHAHLKRFIGH
jgi:hypothetical protein